MSLLPDACDLIQRLSPPDAGKIRAAIDQLEGADLKTATIEEMLTVIREVSAGFVMVIPEFLPSIPIFRAQIGERPSNIRRMLYPPADLTPLGRANVPGKPVLYCATTRNAAVIEVAPEVGERVTLAAWTTTRMIRLTHVGYHPESFSSLKSERPVAGWAGAAAQHADDEGSQLLARFMSGVFTQRVAEGEEAIYKLSNAIAQFLCAHETLDGLIYPTVRMSANADCIALRTETADAALKFERTEHVRIDSRTATGYEVSRLDTASALLSDGDIQWRGGVEKWTIPVGGGLEFRTDVFGRTAWDQGGNIVEPDK